MNEKSRENRIMIKKIVFATNNANKLKEIKDIVGDRFEILSLNDINCHEEIEETGATFQENALIKAQHVKLNYGYDCFADDSGLEVYALNGEPGIFSSRYAGENGNSTANMNKLLKNLEGEENRNARFRTVIALIFNGETHYFEGTVSGTIIDDKRGGNGFGYDPIFVPDGYQKTFAELEEKEKNLISHRAKATKKLIEFLKKQ